MTPESDAAWAAIFEAIQRFMDDTTFEEAVARFDAIGLDE